MSEKFVKIPAEEYECLRRHLSRAVEIFDSLGVGSSVIAAPKLTPKKKLELKYQDKLDNYLAKKINN